MEVGLLIMFYSMTLYEVSSSRWALLKKDSVLYTNDLMLGSTKMISENPNTLSILEAITSKGGTTEAALKELKNKNLQKIVSQAISHAYKKSQKILDK